MNQNSLKREVASKMIHMHSNCPRCRTGIMTPYMTLNSEKEILKSQVISSEFQPNETDFVITICSLSVCGYSEILASPGLLLHAKRKRRERNSELLVE